MRRADKWRLLLWAILAALAAAMCVVQMNADFEDLQQIVPEADSAAVADTFYHLPVTPPPPCREERCMVHIA